MSKRILLVEDEPNIIEAIRFILSRDGWHVSTHSDGTSALDAILRGAPDVLVLDVMLPGRSGFDILRDLRAHEATRDLPVLMLTAKGQGRDRAQAERYGVTRFMTKPFANAEVLEAVNAMHGSAGRAGDAPEGDGCAGDGRVGDAGEGDGCEGDGRAGDGPEGDGRERAARLLRSSAGRDG